MTHFNKEQNEAIMASADTPLLVLAPAGSGKTSTLIQRVIKLCKVDKFHPNKIIAVTFTKKAAAEIHERLVEKHPNLGMVQSGTFHRIALDILKMLRNELPHCSFATNQHSIIDSDGQKSIIRRIVKENPPRESLFPDKKNMVASIAAFINNRKEEMLRSREIEVNPKNEIHTYCTKIYELYESDCVRKKLLDFAEIILRLVEGLRDHKNVREFVQSKIDYVLVDEYQDTNPMQSAFVDLLIGSSRRLTCVGDDDQSIYSWRGAKNTFILNFEKRNPGANVITLHNNYRSTKPIIAAANNLIIQNSVRHAKKMISNKSGDIPIFTKEFYNSWDEANHIADEIKKKVDAGEDISSIAILYRRNSLSFPIESCLTERSIPYAMATGVGFFDREEILAALAYLTLIHNPTDSAAFERVCSYPKRGIGDKKIAVINYLVASQGMTFLEALEEENSKGSKILCAVLKSLTVQKHSPLTSLIHSVLHETGLYEMFEKHKDATKSEVKTDNLNVLMQIAERSDKIELEDFLENIVLTSEGRKTGEDKKSVILSTVHGVKGLEFEHVYVAGFSENIFPHSKSVDVLEQLEEERRLAYVAITRAKSELSLTSFKMESKATSANLPSRFLSECGLTINGKNHEIKSIHQGSDEDLLAGLEW